MTWRHRYHQPPTIHYRPPPPTHPLTIASGRQADGIMVVLVWQLANVATLEEFKWARMCVCSRNFG